MRAHVCDCDEIDPGGEARGGGRRKTGSPAGFRRPPPRIRDFEGCSTPPGLPLRRDPGRLIFVFHPKQPDGAIAHDAHAGFGYGSLPPLAWRR